MQQGILTLNSYFPVARWVSSNLVVLIPSSTGTHADLTLKESSRFSPPQISKPGSYVPMLLKYSLSMENNPPAMVGVLQKQGCSCAWPRLLGVNNPACNIYGLYLMGAVGSLTTPLGAGSQWNDSVQSKPPLTMEDAPMCLKYVMLILWRFGGFIFTRSVQIAKTVLKYTSLLKWPSSQEP